MDPAEQKLLADIEAVGWHVIIVPEDEVGPGFAYSIGLFKSYGEAEVIVFGLPNDRMHALVNLVGEDAKNGRRWNPGESGDGFIDGYVCRFECFPKDAYRDFLGYARWFYRGDEFPAVQLVWPDRTGHFPPDAACEAAIRNLQPFAGR